MNDEKRSPRSRFPFRPFLWAIALVLAASAGLFLAWDLVIAPRKEMERRLAEKDAQIVRIEKENERLETYLRLLQYTERRARLEVLSQYKDADGQNVNTIRFTEISPDGTPIGMSRDLNLAGDEVYVDTLMIKFEEHFIEQGDPLKGKALLLLRRLFTNRLKPDDGVQLDKEGQPPELYAAQKAPTEFEKTLWRRFWEIANDEKLAQQYGVKAVHGQAVYGKLEPRKVYNLIMRSTGETILPPPTDLQP